MSRSASISLEFVANLDPARAKYESFVKEIQSKPISVPVTVGGGQNQPTTAEAATFGSPGGRITGSISTPASNRLDMLTFKPFSGGAPPGPLGMQGGGGGAGGGMPWGAASANWSYLLAQQSQQIVGGLTPTSSPNWSYFMGQRGGGGHGQPFNRNAYHTIHGYGVLALAAVHELAQAGEAQLDYNAMLAGNATYAAGSPQALIQQRPSQLLAFQQMRSTQAASGAGIVGGAIGTVLGSMIAPGIGTMIGAGVGTAVGQGIGRLGYSYANAEDNARDVAEARRRVDTVSIVQQQQQRQFNAEQESGQIGRGSVGAELNRIGSRYATLDREMAMFRRDNPYGGLGAGARVNALDDAQNAERGNLIAQTGELTRAIQASGVRYTRGAVEGRRAEINHEIRTLAADLTNNGADLDNARLARIDVLRSELTTINRASAANIRSTYNEGRGASVVANRNAFGAAFYDFASGVNTAGMELDDPTRAAKFYANQAQFSATAQVIRRQNVEASYDIERGNLAARQLREGYGLESSLTRIETNRQQQLREIGGTGSSILDRLFGFTRRREAVNAGAGEQITAARQDEARRVIGVQGGIRAGQYGLHDQPLNAQLTEINTRYDQLREGVTNPQRLAELGRSQAVELLQAQQQFNNQTKLINIGQKYTSLSLDRLFAWDATGAQADTIAGQSIMQANQYAFSGRPGQAEAERGIGLKNLQLLKRNYLAGFEGGAEIDPWSVRRAPRDFTDPVATLDEIAKRQQDLKNAKFGSDPAEVPDILKRIEGMFGGLVANIMSMATAQ